MTRPDRATPEKAWEVQAQLLAQVHDLTPDIARYWNDGWVPVVVISPHPEVVSMLTSLGWKDNRSCFGVRRSALEPMLRYPSERAWLNRPRTPGLIQAFVTVHKGTILMVRQPGAELWDIEPGTLDGELLS